MRVAVALLILEITTAYSQPQSVDPHKAVVFSGYVRDPFGASIPATISLEDQKKIILWTMADRTGRFAIEARPGEFTLRVISSGFTTYQQSIRLDETSPIKQDIVLQISNLRDDCYACVPPKVEPLDASLTSTLPPNPLPPLKLHKRPAR